MKREEIKTSTPILPAGYTQLKSLGCTGLVASNYILTDFRPRWDWTIRGKFSFLSIGPTNPISAWLCGTYTGYGSYRQCWVAAFPDNLGTKINLDTCFGGYRTSGAIDCSYDTGTIFEFEAARDHVIIAGTTVTYSSWGNSNAMNNFTLFCCDGNDKNKRYSNHKINILELYDANMTLIHQFIPAMRDLDSKLGVYDLSGNMFYAVTGTQFNYETL